MSATGGPKPPPQRVVGEEQVEGGLELGVAAVRKPTAAATRLTHQDLRPALHQRGNAEAPGLGQHHREALEERRLHQQGGAGDARVANVRVDEPRLDDVGVRR